MMDIYPKMVIVVVRSLNKDLNLSLCNVNMFYIITSYVIDFTGPMRSLNILKSIDDNQTSV